MLSAGRAVTKIGEQFKSASRSRLAACRHLSRLYTKFACYDDHDLCPHEILNYIVFLTRFGFCFTFSNESEEVEKDIEEANQQTREGRSKRAVFNLYSMIKCATGCDPLIYKGYGCYCGFLGSGHVVDGIDRCCKIHDNCYTTSKCPMFLEYFVPYLWKCYRGRPLCGE